MSFFLPTLFNRVAKLAEYPAFHLIYLVFYFLPWFFVSLNKQNVALSLLVMAIFVPLHFWAFTQRNSNAFIASLMTEILMISSAGLIGSHGVYHIYAASYVAYIKSTTKLLFSFLTITIIYILTAYLFDKSLFQIILIVFFSTVVWLQCCQDANQTVLHEQEIQAKELEKQQAAILERERIARDLHDTLGHTLTMVSLKSDVAIKLLTHDVDAARVHINDIRTSSRQTLNNIREILNGLQHTTLIQELKNAKIALSTANIRLVLIGKPPVWTKAEEHTIALCIRELTTNTIRHSQATILNITFGQNTPKEKKIVIKDNGIGMHKTTAQEGNGLLGLRQRIASIGGRVSIRSHNGMSITIFTPNHKP